MQARTTGEAIYNLRPRRPPFLLVESVGIGVTSSADKHPLLETQHVWAYTYMQRQLADSKIVDSNSNSFETTQRQLTYATNFDA